MSINFDAINSKLSKLATDFQTPDLMGATEDIKNKLQASSESIFKNVDGLQESLTAKLSDPDLLAKLPTGAFSSAELESKLKGLAGEVKGGMQMVGPIAADLADKAKILEPQLAAVSQDIADKLPAMKEAISSTDLANIDKAFTAAAAGVTAIDIHDIFPDVQATVENVAEMNFDIVTTANLEGITTALQTAIPDLPLEDLKGVMDDLVPSDILGIGALDPFSLMQDFQKKLPLDKLSAATKAATAGFENALGGLTGGGLLMGALESTSSVISNTIFGAIPSFDQSKLGDLTKAFAGGDSKACRALAIGNIQLSDKLKDKLSVSDISAKFGSIADLQSILSNAEGLILRGILGKELSSLQSVVDNIESVFPNILPTPGSFLKKDNPLPVPTVGTITFKGGKATTESKGDGSSTRLYDHKEVISYFKSAERTFTTLVFDWTGTYSDQNMSAQDVHAHYKANGKSGGIPYHILIQKNGHMELGRFLEDLPLIGGGYNDNAIFVGIVAGYNTPAPKEAFHRSVLSSASVTKQQFGRMKIIARAFTDVLPIGQIYGISELTADRTTVSRSGPGVNVESIRKNIDKDVIGMGEIISNGKFFTTEELKARIETKGEEED